jgi:hypothetical protein
MNEGEHGDKEPAPSRRADREQSGRTGRTIVEGAKALGITRQQLHNLIAGRARCAGNKVYAQLDAELLMSTIEILHARYMGKTVKMNIEQLRRRAEHKSPSCLCAAIRMRGGGQSEYL